MVVVVVHDGGVGGDCGCVPCGGAEKGSVTVTVLAKIDWKEVSHGLLVGTAVGSQLLAYTVSGRLLLKQGEWLDNEENWLDF